MCPCKPYYEGFKLLPYKIYEIITSTSIFLCRFDSLNMDPSIFIMNNFFFICMNLRALLMYSIIQIPFSASFCVKVKQTNK